VTDPFRHDEPETASPDPEAGPGGVAEVAKMSFEVALAELESIVERLERGQLDLEESIRAYERGTELKRHCEARLKEAELRVDRITKGPEGEVAAVPFEVDEGR
jgi:exodeoxyribonuclease VII small subunit